MPSFFFGGDKGSRTPDLLNAIQALSQLSYTPKWLVLFLTTVTLYHNDLYLSIGFLKVF